MGIKKKQQKTSDDLVEDDIAVGRRIAKHLGSAGIQAMQPRLDKSDMRISNYEDLVSESDPEDVLEDFEGDTNVNLDAYSTDLDPVMRGVVGDLDVEA